MNVVTIKINEREYNLKGEEKEEYLHKVAYYVDKKIKDIISKNGKLSTASASVLAALNIADEMFKKEDEDKEIEMKFEKLEKDQQALKKENEELMAKFKIVKEENQTLKNQIEKNNKGTNIKEEEINELKNELALLKEKIQKYVDTNKKMKLENKEMKFELQSSKYKIMELQHKLIQNQIDLVKERKQKQPLLNVNR